MIKPTALFMFQGHPFPSHSKGELYHASVLLLFCPWTDILQLTLGLPTFKDAAADFLSTQDPNIECILTNL
jgi:hypothetical protein